MKKLLCLWLFICCTSGVSLATNAALETNKEKEYSFVDTPKAKYRIYSTNQTIHINQLDGNPYIMIFDASGKNVYKGTTSHNSISVPVRSRGVFIIRIQQGKDIYTEKILIK